MALLNAFDSTNYPTSEPALVSRGERWAWKRGDIASAYPSSAYTVRWVARPESEASIAREVSIAGSASGSDWLFVLATSSSDDVQPGRYRWQLIVTRTSDSEEVVIDRGAITVLADLDEATGDLRSHARRMLDAIEAAIEGSADSTVLSYTMPNGHSLSHMGVAERMQWRSYYRREVYAETVQAARRNGQAGAGQTRVAL